MKQRVLIADDDEGIRDIFRILLEREGYELDIQSNGNKIIENKFTIPDLFLIDKQLSGTSGLDICRYLKSQPHTQHIPLIMISASPDIGSLSKEAGADNYLEKPFDINCLLRMMKDLLQEAAAHGTLH